MTANVTCDPLLLFAVDQTNSFNEQELNVLCTSGCKDSLETFLATITTRCGMTPYNIAGQSQPLTYIPERLFWKYNVTCLKDRFEIRKIDIRMDRG